MPRRRNPLPPRPAHTSNNEPIERGVLELDRFSEKDVNNWNKASEMLDELHDTLQYSLEPERRKYQKQILDALKKRTPSSVNLSGWARIVSYKYALQPLSCAGSLQYIGGRFNAGVDLEPNTMRAWPALYIAEDFATAFLEKFQIEHDTNIEGLSPDELALDVGGSHSTVILQGRLTNVFDMTEPEALNDVARVFGKIKMPTNVNTLKRKLDIPRNNLTMISTGKKLFEVVTIQNWRVLPVQYGLPSNSQILAGLIKAAGFEAIQFKSTKGSGKCIAVFPDALAEDSFVELADAPPAEIKHKLLNIESASELAGWDSVAPFHQSYR